MELVFVFFDLASFRFSVCRLLLFVSSRLNKTAPRDSSFSFGSVKLKLKILILMIKLF